MKACHGHHGKQTYRLQGYCLSSGVGTCDHKGPEVLSQSHVYRDHLLWIDQRMSGIPEFQAVSVVYHRLLGLHLY